MKSINFIHPKSESYGDDIRIFRKYANLTMEQFGNAVGVHYMSVYMWEKYRSRPHPVTFRSINAFLAQWHAEHPKA